MAANPGPTWSTWACTASERTLSIHSIVTTRGEALLLTILDVVSYLARSRWDVDNLSVGADT